MSRLIVVWSTDKASAIARAVQLADGLHTGRPMAKRTYDVVMAEDLDRQQGLTSPGEAFAVVLQVHD